MSTHEVTVDLSGPGDAERILDLNRSHFDGTDLLTSPADYAWRLDNNPAGQGTVPVLRDSSRQVVGFICIIPLRTRVGGQDVKGATGTNLVILPAYRDGLSLTRLMRRFGQACRDQDIALHFSFVSEAQYRQSKHRRPEDVATVPLSIKVLHAPSVAGGILRHYLPGKLGSIAGRCAEAFSFRRRSFPQANPATVQVLKHFDERIDALWRTLSDNYPAMVRRDRAYLEWRFGALAEREYRILVAETEGGISGYLVQRCVTSRGIDIGLIMDLLVVGGEPGEAAAAGLLAEAERYFHERGASLMAALCPKNTGEHAALRKAGCRIFPRLCSPRKFRFSTVYHGGGENREDAISAGEWFATFADWEAF
jgi:hypothetical protein